MSGFLDRFLRKDETRIWTCDPLVVVHAVEGIIFSAPAQVEYRPDDRTGKTGQVQVVGEADRWTPQLTYSQRMETLQTFDVQVKMRTGVILMGEDEAGDPVTWYINGEADRYLTRPPEIERPDELDVDQVGGILSTPINRTLASKKRLNRLHIVRADGFCPVSAAATILVSPTERPPAIEHLACTDSGDDGEVPELFVLERTDVQDGAIVKGIDAHGMSATWYIDSAAEDYLSRLP